MNRTNNTAFIGACLLLAFVIGLHAGLWYERDNAHKLVDLAASERDIAIENAHNKAIAYPDLPCKDRAIIGAIKEMAMNGEGIGGYKIELISKKDVEDYYPDLPNTLEGK